MQRPLAFDATREVIGLFSAAFPFWPRGRPPSGAWRPHQVSPFPREAATGCSWSAISIAAASALRRTRTTKSLRYSIRSVGPESLCPGCRIFPVRQHVLLEPYYMRQNGSHSSPPHINGRGLKLNLFFLRGCGEACHRCSEGNSRSQQRLLGPSRAARPSIRTNLLRIKKARLSTRLGSGAETADHFTRL